MPDIMAPAYPADVQAALDRGREEGWSIEVYQAALSIALGHLDGFDSVKREEERPEVHVMWTDRPIYSADEARIRLVDFETVYLVCPHCGDTGAFEMWDRAIESYGIDMDWDQDTTRFGGSHSGTIEPFEIYVRRVGDRDVSGDGDDSYLVHTRTARGRSACYSELAIPEWLEFDD